MLWLSLKKLLNSVSPLVSLPQKFNPLSISPLDKTVAAETLASLLMVIKLKSPTCY